MNLPTSTARPRRRPATDAAAGLMLALAATSAYAAPPTQPPAPPVPPHHHDRYADDEDSMAGRAIDERRSLKADARVRVSNVAGSIEIVSWDKNEAYISGELGRGADKLDITGSDGSLDIVVRTPKNTRNVEGSELRIMLPVGVALNVEAVSADVIVQGIKGKVVAATVSGEMRVRMPAATSAQVTLHTFSGDVRSAFGGAVPSGDERRERQEFKIGDGRARVDLSSFSGDIVLDKR